MHGVISVPYLKYLLLNLSLAVVLAGFSVPAFAKDSPSTPVESKSAVIISETLKPRGSGLFFQSKTARLFITKLDGKSLSKFSVKQPFPESMALTPGRHEMSFSYQHFGTYANTTLWLVAEEGKSYTAKKRVDGNAVAIWIEETSTGKIVGGILDDLPDEPKEDSSKKD
jgi:hypothetical protein